MSLTAIRRHIKTIVLAALLFTGGTACPRTAADFFAEAPVEVLPLLDRTTRLDMLDYFAHGLETASRNVLDGHSRITAQSDNKIDIQISRDARLQLAVFTLKADTLLVAIETVLTPVADSDIRIYRSDWTPLASRPRMPEAADFVPADRKRDAKRSAMPEPLFIKAEFDPETALFTFFNTTGDYYTENDRPDGLGLMSDSITMAFDGRRFVEPKAKKK